MPTYDTAMAVVEVYEKRIAELERERDILAGGRDDLNRLVERLRDGIAETQVKLHAAMRERDKLREALAEGEGE